MGKKRIYYLIIIVSILLISGLYVFERNSKGEASQHAVQKGSASFINFSNSEVMRLDGIWDFYPEVLLTPGMDDFEDYNSIKQAILVPGPIDEHIRYGTYRLRIDVPTQQHYAFKARTIRSAYNLYIDGKLVHTSGVVSEDINSVKKYSRYVTLNVYPVTETIDVVIQVSPATTRGGILNRSEERRVGKECR